MVSDTLPPTELAVATGVWAVLETVMDPEIPVVSVVDLGIVRGVRTGAAGFEVVITPTYTGCPATRQIEDDIRAALDRAAQRDDSACDDSARGDDREVVSDRRERRVGQDGLTNRVGNVHLGSCVRLIAGGHGRIASVADVLARIVRVHLPLRSRPTCGESAH